MQTPDEFEEDVHIKIIPKIFYSIDITFAPKLKRDLCPFKHEIFKNRPKCGRKSDVSLL